MMMILFLPFLLSLPTVKTDPFSPSFSKNTYSISVPENQNVISQLLVVTATDADLPLTFHQTSNFPEFELTTSGNLNLVQSLDRERISSYQINVMVTDSTGRSSATVVFVSVEDVNDNSPIFTTTVLQTSIPENTPVTTSILQIGATDADIGTNGFVTFTLSVNPDDTFRISQIIGTISLIKPLNFEAVPHYHVVVVASDGGGVSRSASTTVSISITDSSDLNPVFNMTSYFAAIPEQMLSSSVLTVFATDSDLQLGRTINYDIENGNDNNAFDIGLTTGTIEVISSSAIDREVHPNPFILTIKAFEATNSSQSAFVLATIELIDANDEPPVFVGGPFYGEVAENSRIGYSVVTGIAATDADTGDNALFNFRISTAVGVFTIDSDTGEFVVSGSLDREVTPLYTFEIVVFGRFGTPTLSSTATIVINVTDVNDNSPSFLANQFALSVTEEQPVGVSIGTVIAVDVDSGTSGQVAYSLTGLFANRFSVDGTGQITTQAILDRESVPSYEINLVASDMDTIQPRQSTTLLIITVDDINDQNPYFTPVTHSVDVVESVSVPFVLLTVTASDDDIGTNAIVLYSILPSSNPLNNFGVGTSSGVISVISSLDRETNENFILLIVATDMNSLTGTGTVLVTVIDANTENPMFSSSLYQATIPESTPLDTSVVQVMASDADTGANAIISFSLISSADSTFFKIDSKLGNISIANSLDAEAQSIYDFMVRAEDNGFPVRSADSRVQVSVTDTNDNPPTFSATLFTTSVAENLPLASTIMVLTATDSDIDTINNRVNYSLVSESPNQNRFSVLPDSGGVIVHNTLDREVADFHTLVVRGTDSGGLSDTTTLQVTVTDVNDNHPIIQPSYAFNFVENDVIGTRLGTVTATDADEPNTLNSQLKFSIIGGATVSFFIDASTGEITSTQTIDRESTPSLNLTVQVSDSATVPLTDTSRISITVLDVNDNSPVFSAPSYSAELAESTGMGQLVLQVFASDSDEGTNQEIVFSITGGDDLNQFTIGGTNGEVRTSATPTDRETTSEYHLTLTASDRGQPSRQTTSHLRIQINDTNDNKPIFDSSGLFVELSENSSTNIIVATVSASDSDTGSSGTVRYQLVATNSLFSVDAISGVVRLVLSLDRETEDTHVLEITASDLGSPPLQTDTNAILTISVTDSNDNSPQFVQTPNSPISVGEAENPAFVVDTYAATDRDLGANAVVTFTLSGGEGGFEVDRVSGELKVASQLDRETQDSYTLTITAIDGGPIPLSATATVLVSIGDVNDVTPTFRANTPSSVNIKENLDIGQSVTTLTAVDGDIGVNKVVKYTITSSVPTSGLNTFQINEDSGHITVKTNDIDRENIPMYSIIVTATDLGNPPLSSSTNLEVLVSDVNDENPMFTENVYTETILENGAVVTAVLTVTATDADAGANGLVRYSISGPEAAMFSIDIESGEISTNGTFDFETKSQYSFTATAVDDGNATRQGSATVIVTIADLNDNHPSIQLTTYSAQLFEDAIIGTVLLDVNATDRDTGANAVVKFEKISGSDDFLIDFDTGELKVSKALDRETVLFYSITVKAIDQGTPQLDSQPLIVQIDILDVNDNSPQFNTPITSNINIPEDTPVAMSVAQLFASDPDFGDNGTISFSLTGSNSFDVTMTTGVVRVSLILDRETKDSYSLTITASDNGTPPRSVQSSLLISITDINDNAPIFNDTIQSAFSIREDTLIGQVLVRVEASDLDLGINQEINFRLVDSNPITGLDTFGIDATSGDIFVAINNTDRESIGQYVLKIEALDGGVPVLSANLSIFITITDYNDNAPVFTQSVFDLSIPESTAPHSAIHTFSSTDNDEGVNSEVSYTISGSDVANFSINTSTGVLSTRDKFDFETNTFYTFLIIATDRGVPPLSGVKTVTVSILDANDNAPILSDSKYSKGLLDSFNSGATVFVFNATDLDSNNFGLVRFELVGRFSGFEVDREKGVLVSTGILTGQVGRTLDFEIKAFDNEGEFPTLFDIESVHVVVISQNHVVELVLDRSPEFVFSTQHSIEDILTRETELVVIIDTISPFYDTSNFIDPDKSVVTIHATHPTTSGLIETDALVRALDEREAFINELLLAIRVQLAAPIVPRDTTLVTAELALIIVSAALFLFIVFCGCILCVLICQIFRIRRRKREYAKSYASLSTYIPSQSVLTSPTELMSSTNPLYTQPYLEKESYLQKTSRRYESQELTMEMFGDDLNSLGHTTVVDLFDDDSVMNGRFRDAIDSVVESIDDEDLQVLVDYESEDGSGISII